MSREEHDRMGTADLVAGADQQREAHREPRNENMPPQAGRGERPVPQQMQPPPMQPDGARQHPQAGMGTGPEAAEPLAALFPPQVAQEFRSRWDQVQIGFVDDPRRAVQQADELVAQVMKSLASTFAEQRARLEAGLGQGTDPNTEDLRVALRGYRSFFQRLLSL